MGVKRMDLRQEVLEATRDGLNNHLKALRDAFEASSEMLRLELRLRRRVDEAQKELSWEYKYRVVSMDHSFGVVFKYLDSQFPGISATMLVQPRKSGKGVSIALVKGERESKEGVNILETGSKADFWWCTDGWCDQRLLELVKAAFHGAISETPPKWDHSAVSGGGA